MATTLVHSAQGGGTVLHQCARQHKVEGMVGFYLFSQTLPHYLSRDYGSAAIAAPGLQRTDCSCCSLCLAAAVAL